MSNHSRSTTDHHLPHDLASVCSLCGDGYHPHLEISISDDAVNGEYRWCHVQCKHDHDAAFLTAFADTFDDSGDEY